MARVKPPVGYAPEEHALIQQAAHRVWDAIAIEVLSASGVRGLRRDQLVSVLCGGKRIAEELRRMKVPVDLIAKVIVVGGLEPIVSAAFPDQLYTVILDRTW